MELRPFENLSTELKSAQQLLNPLCYLPETWYKYKALSGCIREQQLSLLLHI